MRFTITSLVLIKALKLMQGFNSESERRPVLKQVHIIADANKQNVCFEATNNFKAARWYLDVEVGESGEGFIEITNYMLALLKCYKNAFVKIYSEDNITKACIYDNIIVLSRFKDKYANLSTVYNIDAVDSKPLIDIEMLQSALKAMANAGAKYVELNIPTNQIKTIKLIASHTNTIDKDSIEAIILPIKR